jgi:hypothetical protein
MNRRRLVEIYHAISLAVPTCVKMLPGADNKAARFRFPINRAH